MTNDIRPKKPRSVQLVQCHVEKEFMDLALLVINDTFFYLWKQHKMRRAYEVTPST
jgi:hypothetical protein